MSNIKKLYKINQLFFNNGIKQENRFEVFLNILKKNNNNIIDFSNNLEKEINDILKTIDLQDLEFTQESFMILCSEFTKYKLDQFYTPITISSFINNIMISDNNIAIEPACGTGDLISQFKGTKYLWDIDKEVLKLCEFNLCLRNNTNYFIEEKNSLLDYEEYKNKATYVVINPPFGSNTVTIDENILSKYVLGKGKKKQELGILFIELGIKLLKNDGILFIILPSGYFGNKNKNFTEMRNYILDNYSILGILEFPKNTFKRSGTGVDTYLWIIQKCKRNKPYNIFIERIDNIGYDLSKKDTPCKYKLNENGDIIILNDIKLVDNDLISTFDRFQKYCIDNNINNVNKNNYKNIDYETISTNKLDSNILDIKRYSKKYLQLLNEFKSYPNIKKIKDLGKIHNKVEKIEKNKKYLYIDIGEINTPLYNYKELFGWELPSRAKYIVQKNDILVSKLDGKISYTVICEDKVNIIVTNGVCVIRPNNQENLYILFINILKDNFKIQHNAFTTGSIMASIMDSDIEKILINCDENIEIAKKIIDTITILKHIS
jgi:hypothetical protein